MPEWPISCPYKGLQPWWKMTKQLEIQASGEYDEMVLTKNTETIDAFSSHVITTKAGTAHTSERINVMTWALSVEDGSLPQGLTVQNGYTKLRKGSKNVIMVVRTSMAYPQTLRKKTPVARAVRLLGYQSP